MKDVARWVTIDENHQSIPMLGWSHEISQTIYIYIYQSHYCDVHTQLYIHIKANNMSGQTHTRPFCAIPDILAWQGYVLQQLDGMNSKKQSHRSEKTAPP